MKKDVLIKIKDKQTVDGEIEKMEIITKGSYEGVPDDYTLEFTERFDEDFECLTKLFVKEKRCVTMLRSGKYNSELIIENRKRHNCHYLTPYGEFMIGIYAKRVESNMNGDGGTLKMNYTIDYYSGIAAENEMIISVGAFTSG